MCHRSSYESHLHIRHLRSVQSTSQFTQLCIVRARCAPMPYSIHITPFFVLFTTLNIAFPCAREKKFVHPTRICLTRCASDDSERRGIRRLRHRSILRSGELPTRSLRRRPFDPFVRDDAAVHMGPESLGPIGYNCGRSRRRYHEAFIQGGHRRFGPRRTALP